MVKYNLPVEYSKLSPSERKVVREQYIDEQDGYCWFCKEHLGNSPRKDIDEKWIHGWMFPESFFNYPIHLHHDHDTDLTIGAVHAKCNAVLWQYYGK